MILSISNIDKLQETGKLTGNIKIVAEIFLSAINDWPEPVLSFEDYEEQVREFINEVTTKKNIELALEQIDVSKNAWKTESLSQILEIFQFSEEEISLRDIISFLKMQLSHS